MKLRWQRRKDGWEHLLTGEDRSSWVGTKRFWDHRAKYLVRKHSASFFVAYELILVDDYRHMYDTRVVAWFDTREEARNYCEVRYRIGGDDA